MSILDAVNRVRLRLAQYALHQTGTSEYRRKWLERKPALRPEKKPWLRPLSSGTALLRRGAGARKPNA